MRQGILDPEVGIFWVINKEPYIYSTPVGEAERSGEFVNHPNGHFDFWEELSAKDSPIYNITKGKDYDFFSRGRVVYSLDEDIYYFYADKCIIDRKDLIKEIVKRMNLPKGKYKVISDFHYQCSNCNKDYY